MTRNPSRTGPWDTVQGVDAHELDSSLVSVSTPSSTLLLETTPLAADKDGLMLVIK